MLRNTKSSVVEETVMSNSWIYSDSYISSSLQTILTIDGSIEKRFQIKPKSDFYKFDSNKYLSILRFFCLEGKQMLKLYSSIIDFAINHNNGKIDDTLKVEDLDDSVVGCWYNITDIYDETKNRDVEHLINKIRYQLYWFGIEPIVKQINSFEEFKLKQIPMRYLEGILNSIIEMMRLFVFDDDEQTSFYAECLYDYIASIFV